MQRINETKSVITSSLDSPRLSTYGISPLTVDAVITGANGFIGQHLARRLLLSGQRVRLYVRNSQSVESLKSLGAEVVEGTLSDSETLGSVMQGAETVYHLAASKASFHLSEMMVVNRDGTYQVANSCAKLRNPPMLIYVSSVAAAGPTLPNHLRKETEEPTPISNYGRSKLAGEKVVAAFANKFPVTIIRPGIVFGPGDKELLLMLQAIKTWRAHFVVGSKTPQLSMLHVDDLVDLIVRAALFGTHLPYCEGDLTHSLTAGGGVYFASDAQYPTYEELGIWARELLHRPYAQIMHLTGPLPWIAGVASEMMARITGHLTTFNLDKIREAKASSWACSSEFARYDLGFSPALSLRERFAETIKWYEAEKWM